MNSASLNNKLYTRKENLYISTEEYMYILDTHMFMRSNTKLKTLFFRPKNSSVIFC